MRLIILTLVFGLCGGCASQGTLAGITTIVIGDEEIPIDQAHVVRHGEKLYLENPLPVQPAAACHIELNGFSEARIETLTAGRITILMDGNSRLEVGRLAGNAVDVTTAGLSRVDADQASE